ncbi:MAG: hypothetical protein NTX69_04360 [Candidatus Bipolaricaulota bacterium]|nr:hypothetical protein [Candidatus Bipolaricaulota bacterium]
MRPLSMASVGLRRLLLVSVCLALFFSASILGQASASLGVAKEARVETHGDGSFTVTYVIHAVNLGTLDLHEVRLEDDLASAFSGAWALEVVSVTSQRGTVRADYDGRESRSLLSGADSLAVDETIDVTLVVRVTVGGDDPIRFANSALGTALAPDGSLVTDISEQGSDPDPDQDTDSSNNDTPTVVALDPRPATSFARVSTYGSFETTLQIVDAPFKVAVTSIVFDSSVRLDSFSARCYARLTDTNYDLLMLSASGVLGTGQLSSSLVFNPTTASFVSAQATGTLDILEIHLTDMVYITSPQSSSYTLLRASGDAGPLTFDASATFGVCPFAFSEASIYATWEWQACSSTPLTPLRTSVTFDDQTGFESFTASVAGIPILEDMLGGAGLLLDVTAKFTPMDKVLTPTLRFEPDWLVCPEFRLFGELVLSSGLIGVDGISIYGLRIECPIGDFVFRVADSFVDSKNSSMTGKAAFFEFVAIEGPITSCCASPGRVKLSAYFERPPAPSGALFGIGLLAGSVDFRVTNNVAAYFSAEFTPVAPHLHLLTRLRVNW